MNDIVKSDGLSRDALGPIFKFNRLRFSFERQPYIVSGHTAVSGKRYVRVDREGVVGWAALEAFAGSSTAFVAEYAQHSLVLIGPDLCRELRDAASRLRHFPVGPLIEQPGWTGPYFALPSGKIFQPKGHPDGVVLFKRLPQKCAQAGSLKGWLKAVAKPLVHQRIPTFVLMVAFTGPLLDLVNRDGNFGFELVGAKGKGKSTLQMLMASIFGRGHLSAKGQFLMTCRATLNGLEAAMRTHAHMSLILEDASLFAPSRSKQGRAADFSDFAHSLYAGRTKARFDSPEQECFRFTYLLSSNERLADVLEGHSATVSEAACDRLITIPIDADRPFGVFDSISARFKGSAELARALVNAIEMHHGRAFPRFVENLVRARHKNEASLRAKIERYVRAFQEAVGVDPNDGSAQRVTGAFGLVYAAGMLAKAYGALPSSFKCMKACKATYVMHMSAGKPRPFRDRLISVSRRPDVVNLDKVGLTKMSKSELHKPAAFLRTNRSGEREIRLVTKALKRAFPDWPAIRDTEEVKALLRSHGGRSDSQCKLRTNSNKDRAFCFVIGDEEE